MIDFVVSAAQSDRLDRILARQLSQVSRAHARRLIAAGCVFVDGRRCRIASRELRGGARVRVTTLSLLAEASPLRILYEDADLVAIDKPAAMAAAPTRVVAMGTAYDVMQGQLRRRDGPPARLFLVHRLDVGTSGVLLFAKRPAAAAVLSEAFRRQEAEKVYLAIVAGRPASESGRVDAPIRTVGRRSEISPRGRPSRTEWRRIGGDASTTVLEVRPRTGRMHQIRVHLASIEHPVLGDRAYGGPPASRLMLHAAVLRFRHPSSGKSVEIAAAPPEEWGLVKPPV